VGTGERIFNYLFIYLFNFPLTHFKCNGDKNQKQKGALQIMEGTLTS
jgi:hypothetical protein